MASVLSASTSAMENVADELSVSSLVFSAPAGGAVFTGASLTALTLTATVSVSLCAPPVPLLPWSFVTSWTWPSLPL